MQVPSTIPGPISRIIGGLFIIVVALLLFPVVLDVAQVGTDMPVGEVMCVREYDGHVVGKPDEFTPPACPANTIPATFNEGGIRDDSLRFPGDPDPVPGVLPIVKLLPLVYLAVAVMGAGFYMFGGFVGSNDIPTQGEDETPDGVDTIEEQTPEKGAAFIESKYHRRGGAGAHQYNPAVRPYRVDRDSAETDG